MLKNSNSLSPTSNGVTSYMPRLGIVLVPNTSSLPICSTEVIRAPNDVNTLILGGVIYNKLLLVGI